MKKKIFAIIMLAVMSFAITACGTQTPVSSQPVGNEQLPDVVVENNNDNNGDAANENDENNENTETTGNESSSSNDENNNEDNSGSDNNDADSQNENNNDTTVGDAASGEGNSSTSGAYIKDTDEYTKHDNGCFIYDEAGLLEDEEEDVILSYLDGMAHFGTFGIVTVEKTSYDSTKEFSRLFYSGVVAADDGLIFVIDLQHRTLFVYSHGQLSTYIDDQKAENIVISNSTFATEGNYSECVNGAILMIANYLGMEIDADESFNGATF